MNNVKRIYTLTENANTPDEYCRYYVQLRNEPAAHEVTRSLHDTLRALLLPYKLSGDSFGAVYGEEFQWKWTQEVDDTHDAFLAGTGRW